MGTLPIPQVPSDVQARGTDVFVKLGNCRMPLSEKQMKEMGIRKPRTIAEAGAIALQLRKNRTPVPSQFRFTGVSVSLNKLKRIYRGRFKGSLPPQTRKAHLEQRQMRRTGQMKAEILQLAWADTDKVKTRTELSEIAVKHSICLLSWDKRECKMELKIGSEKADVPKSVNKYTKDVYEMLNEMGFLETAEVKWSD